VNTWKGRLTILASLGFIDIKPGQSGDFSYALIFNPHLVIRSHFEKKTPGLTDAAYNALRHRAVEVGEHDLDDAPAENAVDVPVDLVG
jgi:hypothetical protein